ncbi:hypothetical protein RND71_010539 [Anisodus tanguticus]|uniref:Uncharacterized protein n=1 Tax=Anisodus tanguticus TaxID=243964 RepID=A0AAE1VS86_9SOLA|nr:hypothetical protein RND71_010539 [Anisodus tanguticus]
MSGAHLYWNLIILNSYVVNYKLLIQNSQNMGRINMPLVEPKAVAKPKRKMEMKRDENIYIFSPPSLPFKKMKTSNFIKMPETTKFLQFLVLIGGLDWEDLEVEQQQLEEDSISDIEEIRAIEFA